MDKLSPKATIGSVQVWCNHDRLVDIDKLIPFPRNPNIHPQQQIEALAKIIKHQGWRAPVTVSNRSGYVVRGHGRLGAAKLLGLPQVPVDYQDYENDAAEWADLICDNKIAEFASMDDALLRDLMSDIKDFNFDMELTGFGEGELLQMFEAGEGSNDPEKEWEGMPEFEQKDLSGIIIKIHFENENDIQSFAKLVGQKITGKTKYLWYPKKDNENYGRES